MSYRGDYSLCLLVLHTFDFSLPCNSAWGHAVSCIVAGNQKVSKTLSPKSCILGFQKIKVSAGTSTTTNTFITQHDEQYRRQTEKWDLNDGRKCSIIFHTTKAKTFQVFTRRSKMKKSTMRIITEIDPPP